ncbi:MAG: FMN reductase (NAD(P)H) [Pelotomaculum sp. PtaB.Bin013]|nr:MAG: FMN reductase (NAD(P)H) [Pelotomaculum sp. PtaB.Bin013]
MNETMNTILNRRSIRAYQQEQIKNEELNTILEAGRYAPSGGNTQSWHFSVIQKAETLQLINEACRSFGLRSGNKVFEDMAKAQNFSAFYHAPTLIIVSNDEKVITPQLDSALALGNMFLAAESIGIGSCWIHAIGMVLNSEESAGLRKSLKIPEGYRVYGAGAFGYKAESPSPAPRKEGTVTVIK